MGQLRQFEHERSASPIAVAWSQAKPHQKYEMYRKIRVVIRWRKLRVGKAVSVPTYILWGVEVEVRKVQGCVP